MRRNPFVVHARRRLAGPHQKPTRKRVIIDRKAKHKSKMKGDCCDD